MNWVFVDTSAWCAFFDKSDSDHNTATEYFEQISFPLITSNYVIDETLTLVRNRIGHGYAIKIGKQFFAGHIAQIVRVTAQDEESAFRIFERFSDKGFSFTDCTSFIVMERLNISTACAFDIHFKQYGKLIIVP